MSTPRMSCERVMSTDCSFEDDHTTYISTWPRQKSEKDCENKCKLTTIPVCHFWMHHWSNETCDLYERDKRICKSVGGPASLTGLYCTGISLILLFFTFCNLTYKCYSNINHPSSKTKILLIFSSSDYVLHHIDINLTLCYAFDFENKHLTQCQRFAKPQKRTYFS